jgi:eukaryotic-like serine/threonine-protein kinase
MESDITELGPNHQNTIFGMHKLAIAYRAGGQPANAILTSKEALKRSLGRNDPMDHQGPLIAMNDLALAYQLNGQSELAIQQYEEAIRWLESRSGANPQLGFAVRENLGNVCLLIGRADRAIPHLRVMVKQFQEEFGEFDTRTASAQAVLGLSLLTVGAWGDAETVLRSCLKTREAQEPEDWKTFNARSMLGGALLGQKMFADARPLLLEGYKGMKDRQAIMPNESEVRLVEAVDRLVNLYVALEEPADVARWRNERATYPHERAPLPRHVR